MSLIYFFETWLCPLIRFNVVFLSLDNYGFEFHYYFYFLIMIVVEYRSHYKIFNIIQLKILLFREKT